MKSLRWLASSGGVIEWPLTWTTGPENAAMFDGVSPAGTARSRQL